MSTIDYVYRFDPKNPSTKLPPADAAAARTSLEEGNRLFARWIASCQAGTPARGEAPHYVVACNGAEVGLVRKPDGTPMQAPFAVVVGCSDARVPTEMIFGQGFNNLFIIRVAGNVLGDVCLGSVHFAVEALRESVKIVVVLGHSGCGGVTGAVNTYLRPHEFWSPSTTPALQDIQQKIFVAVRESAGGLTQVWGPAGREKPGYRAALIEAAVCLNAAHAAYALRRELERTGHQEVEVFYGIYDLQTCQVGLPHSPLAHASDQDARLAPAPTDPHAFHSLAVQMAEVLRPTAG